MNKNNQSSNHNIIKNFNNVTSILCLINPTPLGNERLFVCLTIESL